MARFGARRDTLGTAAALLPFLSQELRCVFFSPCLFSPQDTRRAQRLRSQGCSAPPWGSFWDSEAFWRKFSIFTSPTTSPPSRVLLKMGFKCVLGHAFCLGRCRKRLVSSPWPHTAQRVWGQPWGRPASSPAAQGLRDLTNTLGNFSHTAQSGESLGIWEAAEGHFLLSFLCPQP